MVEWPGGEPQQLYYQAADKHIRNWKTWVLSRSLLPSSAPLLVLEDIFPKVRYEACRRALCVLDPYGLHLDWQVIETAGKMGSIEIFLNFPIMDMNRNPLWHTPGRVGPEGRARMTAFWGDESWKTAAYRKQPLLFGGTEEVKLANSAVVKAFADRLKSVAGFKYVAEPMPMRNSMNAVVYYLFFASQSGVGAKIVGDIMDKYRNRGV